MLGGGGTIMVEAWKRVKERKEAQECCCESVKVERCCWLVAYTATCHRMH